MLANTPLLAHNYSHIRAWNTMKLLNPEALADDLENGLGSLNPYLELIPKEHRLRLPVCGVVSVAIARALEDAGHKVKLVQAKPRLSFDPAESHVFPVVQSGNEPTVVDATYGSFLRFTGLTPEGILLKRNEDLYPKEKIITFKEGNTEYPSTILGVAALKALVNWKPDPDPNFLSKPPAFNGMNPKEIRTTLGEFWNPDHFVSFTPARVIAQDGRLLRRYIQDANIRLVDN